MTELEAYNKFLKEGLSHEDAIRMAQLYRLFKQHKQEKAAQNCGTLAGGLTSILMLPITVPVNTVRAGAELFDWLTD